MFITEDKDDAFKDNVGIDRLKIHFELPSNVLMSGRFAKDNLSIGYIIANVRL